MKGKLLKKKGLVRTVGAFALGATAGSIIALLYAPASGRATRKRIGMKFRTLKMTTARQLNKTKKILVKKVVHLGKAASAKLVPAREWLKGSSNGRHPARRKFVHAN